MCRSSAADESQAGFTLIEALVALAIVGIGLSSIAALAASAARGTRSLEARLSLLETARTVVNAMPDRAQLSLGQQSGEIGRHAWRLDISPFLVAERARGSPWQPRTVVVSVRSPNGNMLRITTVRLTTQERSR